MPWRLISLSILLRNRRYSVSQGHRHGNNHTRREPDVQHAGASTRETLGNVTLNFDGSIRFRNETIHLETSPSGRIMHVSVFGDRKHQVYRAREPRGGLKFISYTSKNMSDILCCITSRLKYEHNLAFHTITIARFRPPFPSLPLSLPTPPPLPAHH